MHPFLRSPGHLLLMGLVWSPIAFCVILLQSSLSGLLLSDAAILVGPLMGIEFFICLSIWFPCKAIPLERYKFHHVVIRHVLSAVVMTSLWLIAGVFYSEILNDLTENPIWRDEFNKALPMLLMTGLFLYLIFSLIYYMVLAQEKIRKAEQKALENRLSASAAELTSLKASIHPHFLFNSLTSLSTLTRKSPELAQKMCLQLADFLRYSLDYGQKEWVHVQDELDHIENYLGIEKIRLGDKLNLEFDIEPEASEEILPPFSLLPLVENAVKHGFQSSLAPGTMTLSLKKTPTMLFIEVENPYEPNQPAKHGEGYGLASLNKRLANAYNGDADLKVIKDISSFKVTLKLPLLKKPDDTA